MVLDRTGRTDSLPLEAGLKSPAIYLSRFFSISMTYPATLMYRWAGVDLVVRCSRKFLGK